MSSIALVNGRVGTPASSAPAEAILIRDGVIAAIGTTAEVDALAPASAPRIDLVGRTVLPGLIDAHTHIEFCALSRQLWFDVRGLDRAATIAAITGEVSNGYLGTGRWLVAQGTYHQDLPTRAELDAISTDVPILVRESMHRLVANSTALIRAGIARGSISPLGTVVVLDADGTPSGVVEEGYHLFPVPEPDAADLERMLQQEILHSFSRHGVTTIYELPATRAGVRAYQALRRRGDLPARLSLTMTVAPGLNPIVSSIDELAAVGLSTGFGDDRLWLGGAKVFLDGDNEWAFDTANTGKSPSLWGAVTRHPSELAQLLVTAHGGGLQVWIHAIGDLAQTVALDAIETARSVTGPHGLRTRLEHVGNLAIDARTVERLVDLDVTPVPTGAFLHSDLGDGVYAYRTLIDAGLQPPGNSDTGGTQPFATNPWFGIADMVERVNRDGVAVAPEEAVDIATGIRVYTEYSARAGFAEDRLGALAPGMLGDCAVFAVDPRDLQPGQLRTLEADLTIVGGQVVWDRAGELR